MQGQSANNMPNGSGSQEAFWPSYLGQQSNVVIRLMASSCLIKNELITEIRESIHWVGGSQASLHSLDSKRAWACLSCNKVYSTVTSEHALLLLPCMTVKAENLYEDRHCATKNDSNNVQPAQPLF